MLIILPTKQFNVSRLRRKKGSINVMMIPLGARFLKIIVTNKNRDFPHTSRQGTQAITGNLKIKVMPRRNNMINYIL